MQKKDKILAWVSPSSTSLYDTCGWKYKCNKILKNVENDFGISAILGTTTHNLAQFQIMEGYLKNGCTEEITVDEFKAEFDKQLPIYFYKKYDSSIFNEVSKSKIVEIEKRYDENIEEDELSLREEFEKWCSEIVQTSSFKKDVEKMFEAWTNCANNMVVKIEEIFVDKGVVDAQVEVKKFDKYDDEIGIIYITDVRGYTLDGKLIVLELKTSSKTVKSLQATNIEQVLFYKRFLKKEGFEDFEYYMIYSCALKTKQECHVINVSNFEDEDYNESFVSKIEMLKFAIKNDIFPKKFSMSCSFCNVKNCVGCAEKSEED
ncbi:MAG: PD-(D/E)XK nuclease family protein [Clostridium sp.]|uniref:PD-(D/E)XK nuclease family protein n=1 Tax=Clostridium sp. TaxID=1506 RepID=UPI003EE5EBAA